MSENTVLVLMYVFTCIFIGAGFISESIELARREHERDKEYENRRNRRDKTTGGKEQ